METENVPCPHCGKATPAKFPQKPLQVLDGSSGRNKNQARCQHCSMGFSLWRDGDGGR